MQTRRALILVGLSVICNKLDLVTYVGSWIKCPLYFGLSVIRSCLVLVGFPVLFLKNIPQVTILYLPTYLGRWLQWGSRIHLRFKFDNSN